MGWEGLFYCKLNNIVLHSLWHMLAHLCRVKKEPQVCKDLNAIDVHNSNYLELEISKRYNQIIFFKGKEKERSVKLCLMLVVASF